MGYVKVMLALVTIIAISVWFGNMTCPTRQPVETIEGNMRTVGCVDSANRRHGEYQIFVDGRLQFEVDYRHGVIVESIQYADDGSVKLHLREDSNYQLSPVNSR